MTETELVSDPGDTIDRPDPDEDQLPNENGYVELAVTLRELPESYQLSEVTEAVIEALKSGRIKGAGIDTFSQEPVDPSHPLLHMENVVATPHIAGATRETVRRRTKTAAENVFRAAQGLPPLPDHVR